MIVQAVTTWEGTPEKIQETVDNVKVAADVHISLGAKIQDSGALFLAAEFKKLIILLSLILMKNTENGKML